jgi:hypothetical protein
MLRFRPRREAWPLGALTLSLGASFAACASLDAVFSDGGPSDPDASGGRSPGGPGGGASSSAQGGAAGGGGVPTGPGPTTGPGPSGCGDGVIDPGLGEECEAGNLGGQTCEAFGFVKPGGLACTDCKLDPSGCMAICGNGKIEPGETCEDGSPSGPDDGCLDCQLTGLTCGSAIPVFLSPGYFELHGNTAGGGKHGSTACSGEEGSPDRVYVIETTGGFVTAALLPEGTQYDSILYVLTDCQNPASNVWCADNPFVSGREALSFEAQAGKKYFVFVDGYGGQSGAYTLALSLAAGTCADPVRFPLWDGVEMSALGSTSGKPSQEAAKGCDGAPGPEVVYEVDVQYEGKLDLTLQAGPSFDAVLSARDICADVNTQIDCDHSPVWDENINFSVKMGAPPFVLVDGATPAASGAYRLRLQPF